MSKWIDNYRESCKRNIEKRIEKVGAELRELKANYHDFPKGQTLKAIKVREQELEELKVLLNPKDMLLELRCWQDDYKELKKKLCRVYHLADNIDISNTDKSANNYRRLIITLDEYRNEAIDEMFIQKAKTGIW